MASLGVCFINTATSIALGTPCQAFQIDASAGGFTISLPDATSAGDGTNYYFKRQDNTGQQLYVAVPAGQNIDNQSQFLMTGKTQIHVMAYSGNWWIIGK